MTTLAQTAPVRQTCRADFHGVPGVALRDPQGRISFAPDSTGVWQYVREAELPWLTEGMGQEEFTSLLITDANLVQRAHDKNMYPDCAAAVEADAQRRAARAAARARCAA
jgi:hypothetical protein